MEDKDEQTGPAPHEDEETAPSFLENENYNTDVEATDQLLFVVEVPEAVKRGENVVFTVHTTVPSSQKGYVVLRLFEDFEWLHHNLVIGNNTEGVIIPPLPIKPLTDPKSAESLSKRQLGSNTKVLRGDQFELDCKSIQKYLQLMLSHETFGRDRTLEKFLKDEDAPVRARLNKGLITRLSSAIESARKGSHKDVDEYFSGQRNFANEFSKYVKEVSLNYNKMLVAQWRLSSSYRLLATELTSCTAERDEELVKLNRVLKLLSDACEDESTCYELKSGQGEMTLGYFFDLFARYSDSLKEMHLRRTSALMEYEVCEKAAEKAKPVKKAAAEEALEAAKKTFERSSEIGKRQIISFTQLRLANASEAMSKYAEQQLKISQDIYSQLIQSRKALLEMQL